MPDSIWDYLGQFLGAQPQPVAQSTPGFGGIAGPPSPGQTAPTTAPGHMGLMDVLGSPGAQGLLNAYFQLLSTPRSAGWTRGLGAAGAAGLQGFEQAREQQLKMPLEQAQTQEAIAKAGEETSKSAWMKAHPDAAAGVYAPEWAKGQAAKVANAKTATDLRSQGAAMAKKDPAMSQRMIQAADIIEAAPEFYDPDKVSKLLVDPELAQQKTLADIQLKHALAGQVGKPGATWGMTPEGEIIPITAGGPPPPPHTTRFGEKPPAPPKLPAPPKPEKPGVAEKRGADTLQKLYKTYAESVEKPPVGVDYLDLGRKGPYQERRDNWVRKHGIDPTTGNPLAGAGSTTVEADVSDSPAPAGATETGRTAEGGKLKEYRHPDGSLHFHPAGPM